MTLPVTCGGRIDGGGPEGYLPDGGFKGLVGPGERCLGYDAAALPRPIDGQNYQGPPCPDATPGDNLSSERCSHYCLVWAETLFPPGWDAIGDYTSADASCTARDSALVGRDCIQGVEGDRYCAAWFAQYLRRPATIEAHCRYSGYSRSGVCLSGWTCGSYASFLCVNRDGEAWHRELPCEVAPE